MKKLFSILFLLVIFALSAPVFGGVNAAPNTEQNYRRAVILYNFLAKYNSPLKTYSRDFVEKADQYNLDYRLVAAISGVDSTFAQQLPYNSYNAWGWGIYGDNMIYFKSYPEAIGTISKSLRENYIDKWGAKDVYQIGRFYAASPTWAQRVTYFMTKIEDETLPLTL